MAALAPSFSTDFEEIHREHESLLIDMMEFERALDSIDCDREAFANLMAVGEVVFLTRRLVYQLLEHFTREEQAVLVPLAAVRPELSDLVEKLQREHEELSGRTASFALGVEELDSADDLYDGIWQMKEQGKGLTCAIIQHVAREERELADAYDSSRFVR
jgi:hypothetical protein